MTTFELARLLSDVGGAIGYRTSERRWRMTCPCCWRYAALTVTAAGLHEQCQASCLYGCLPLQVHASLELEHRRPLARFAA